MAITNSHKTSQSAAYKPLTLAQENAIDLLIIGKPDREVAECLGIARETVTRWRHEHPWLLQN
jgi:DNA-binding CsgD family transcriptional regulator